MKARVIELGLVSFFTTLSILWYWQHNPSTNGDNADYILLGHALADHGQYIEAWTPEKRVHENHPKGLPYVIAVLSKVKRDITLYKAFVAVCAFAGILLFYLLLGSYMNHGEKAFFLISLLMNFHFMNHCSIVMTEIPYMLLSAAVVVLMLYRKNQYYTFVAILLSLLAIQFKRVGISLFVFVCVVETVRSWRSFHWLLRGALIAVSLGCAIMLFLMFRYAYGINLEMCQRFVYNTGRIWRDLMQAMYPLANHSVGVNFDHLLMIVSGWVLFAFICVGAYLSKRWEVVLYAALFYLPCLLWSGKGHIQRYVICIMPLLFFFLAKTMGWIFSRQKMAVVFACIFLSLSLVLSQRVYEKNLRYYTDDWWAWYDALDWVNDNAPKDAVVMSRKPSLCALYTNRPSTIYAFDTQDEKAFEKVLDGTVDYVVLDKFYWSGATPRYLIGPLKKYKDMLKVEYVVTDKKSTGAAVLRVKK